MSPKQLSSAQLDRAVGAVVASAAGDALGSAYEFGPSHSDSFEPEFGIGVFGHEVGEWTDDTAMAIPILDALARGESLADPDVLGQIVVRWRGWSRTAKDVGTQTGQVLGLFGEANSEQAARDAAQAVHDQTGRSAGNGSLMRTTPVALGYLDDGAEPGLVEAAGRIAQLTHAEEDNVTAVVLWSLAIRHAIRTGELDVSAGLSWVAPTQRERWSGLIAAAVAPGVRPRDFSSQNGWVVRAFQAALAAVAGAESLAEALYRAVRGGGDTDTVAAIAGGLAGARWGAQQLPPSWRGLLHGWPGYTSEELAKQAVLAASGGEDANQIPEGAPNSVP